MPNSQAEFSRALDAALTNNGRFNISGLDLDVALLSGARHNALVATIVGHDVGLELRLLPETLGKVAAAIRAVISDELRSIVDHYRESIDANS